MKILKQLTLEFGEEKSMSSLEDSPANHSHLQGSVKGRMMTVISGQKCLEQYEKFNRASLLGKTFMGLLIGTGELYSNRCKLTWKLKGTKLSRLYFQLVPSTLPTEEIEFGLLLPTPASIQREHHERVKNLKQAGAKSLWSRVNGEQRPNSILDHMNFHGLIPTVQTQGIKQCIGGKSYPIDNSLLPTPRANKVNGCNLDSIHLAKRNKGNLEESIAKLITAELLPTPTADDNPAKNTGKRNQDSLQKRAFQTTGATSQLNPLFVTEMMGFPIDWLILPFLNGEMNQ